MKFRPLLDKFDWLAAWLQSPLLLIIRLYWGISFAQTGWGKLMNLDRTAGYFESLHLPMPKLNAIMAGSTECLGGMLLALGLFARPASVPLIFTMSVAYLTAERDSLQPVLSDLQRFITHFDFAALTSAFDNAEKFTKATPFLFLLASLIVLAYGPGKLSLDALLFRKPAVAKSPAAKKGE
jgi:putative oxidoreductase